MANGKGRATTNTKDVTRKGRGPKSPQSSQGEVAGAGSYYEATITERENMANTRNQGPERNGAGYSIPVVSAEGRETGKK